jgi:urease accessory protein
MIKNILIAIAIITLPFFAHAEAVKVNSAFLSGVQQPIGRLDYLISIIGIGILAMQQGGRSVFTLPAIFIGLLLLGCVIGVFQIRIPYADYILSFSVLAIGVSIAASKSIPEVLITLMIAVFAGFHGYAQGSEMPLISKAFPYILGTASTTIVLCIAGIIIAKICDLFRHGPTLLRYVGAGAAGMGLQLILNIDAFC